MRAALPRLPIAAALALALLAIACDAGREGEPFPDYRPHDDARCLATHERLADVLAGTPLDDAARFARVERLEAAGLRLWRAASEAAAQRGGEQVTADDLRGILGSQLQWRDDRAGHVVLEGPEGEPRSLDARWLRRYASEGDGGSALLSARRAPGAASELLPLEPPAEALLVETLDVLGAASLVDAGETARSAGRPRAEAGDLPAWLAPSPADPQSPERPAPPDGSHSDSEALRTIVAVERTTRGASGDPDPTRAARFRSNVERFYARYPLPPGALTVPDGLGHAAERFLAGVLRTADASAQARGDARLRARDVAPALREALPFEVDPFDDLQFFPDQPEDDRVVVSCYDVESLRDFGLSWRMLSVMAAQGRLPEVREPDAFAVALLAEGLDRYSQVALRLAGEIARDTRNTPFVTGEHLRRAAQEIERRAAAGPAPATADATTADDTEPEASGSGRPLFHDATRAFGIDFVHRSAPWLERFRRRVPEDPPLPGGGVAAGDVNGDGWDDLLLVGGAENVLYRGGPSGFERDPASEALRFAARDGLPAEPRQPLIADFDGDGRQDLLITFVDAPHRLLRNRGDGSFEDVSGDAGLGGPGDVVSAVVAFDYDRDGLLDLYLCRFGDYLDGRAGDESSHDFPGALPLPDGDSRNGQPNRLLHNRGGLRFEEVPDSGSEDTGWCQAAAHTDLDADGWPDLVVANDFGRDRLLRNRGDGRFEDVSDRLDHDDVDHSRSVAIAELNGDGLPDLYVSNNNFFVPARPPHPSEARIARLGRHRRPWQVLEGSVLHLSNTHDPSGTHTEGVPRYRLWDAGIEGGNAAGYAWGADFFDLDNDGDEDLYVANGSSESSAERVRRWVGRQLRQGWSHERNVLYRNEQGRLRDVSPGSGADYPGNSRSVVSLDADADGDLDLVVDDFEGPAHLLRNDLEPGRAHWVGIRLEGDPSAGSTRDAVGARVLARVGTRKLWRELRAGSGHLSMQPRTLHLGLGEQETVDLEIHWPGGRVQEVTGLGADRIWRIAEGREPVSTPMAGTEGDAQ